METPYEFTHPWEDSRDLWLIRCDVWRKFLATVKIEGPIPMRFEVIERYIPWLIVYFEVTDTHTGERTEIGRQARMPPLTPDHAYMERFIHREVLWIYRHEAEENICIGDRRPFYPVRDHAIEHQLVPPVRK